MPNTPTPILSLIVPTVNADDGIWGDELNTNIATLDALGANRVTVSAVSHNLAYGIAPITRCYETAGAGGIIDTLPTAIGHAGEGFFIKKIDSAVGVVLIGGVLGQTIDGLPFYNLVNQYQFVHVESDGANWQIVGNN